jgi:hypothetical protein
MSQPDQVTSQLQTLVRNGLLSPQNLRRWAGYRVPGNSPQLQPDSPQLAKDSRHLSGNSPQYSTQLLPDSRHLDGNSRHLVGDSPHLSPELPSLTGSARRIRYSRIANPSFD